MINRELIIKKLSLLNPKLIIIFGSFAKGETTKDSDLDIAFYSQSEIDNYQRWLLAGDLAIEFNIDVDLIDLKKANDVLRFEIVSNGEVILNKNMDNFLDRSYVNYFVLNEDRKEILDYYDR
jgi:predicted nucleotidyltransferase